MTTPAPRIAASEAWFAPHQDVCGRIIRAFDEARERVDICVFTITDDRIGRAIEAAHRRGIRLRIMSDDLKAEDLGSDIDRLARDGIAVRVDTELAHMHHKFAIVDGALLLNGSYNWTRSAGQANHENLVVTSDPDLIAAFRAEFERVWQRGRAW